MTNQRWDGLTMTRELNFAYGRARIESTRTADPYVIYRLLARAELGLFYPHFEGWFFGKVVPGIRSGERQIITCEDNGAIAGVAICKKSELERKLCTLWIEPSSRTRGLASPLAQHAFDWLESDRPLFTVPEERLGEFSGLLKTWNFSPATTHPDLYRKNRNEYIFNNALH